MCSLCTKWHRFYRTERRANGSKARIPTKFGHCSADASDKPEWTIPWHPGVQCASSGHHVLMHETAHGSECAARVPK